MDCQKSSMKDEHDNAFQKFKSIILCARILRLQDLTRSFILQYDASESGVGIAFLQKFEGRLFAILYASTSFSRERKELYCDNKGMSCIGILYVA